MLIFKDKGVALGDLPSYLARYQKVPLIEFDPYNLDELRAKLAAVMPSFREWIETKRRQEFFEALGKTHNRWVSYPRRYYPARSYRIPSRNFKKIEVKYVWDRK